MVDWANILDDLGIQLTFFVPNVNDLANIFQRAGYFETRAPEGTNYGSFRNLDGQTPYSLLKPGVVLPFVSVPVIASSMLKLPR